MRTRKSELAPAAAHCWHPLTSISAGFAAVTVGTLCDEVGTPGSPGHRPGGYDRQDPPGMESLREARPPRAHVGGQAGCFALHRGIGSTDWGVTVREAG